MENKKLWFRAKRYGLGWYPISWEGWVVILIYVAIIFRLVVSIDTQSHSGSDALIQFAPYFIIITGLLILICYKKGEVLGWRWGGKK